MLKLKIIKDHPDLTKEEKAKLLNELNQIIRNSSSLGENTNSRFSFE